MMRMALACLGAALVLHVSTALAGPPQTSRPNILWITSEDHGPHMGCYGDAYATTPNVDRLARRGMIYAHAWSCAPVCAPARTTIISGMYADSTGSEHMRSLVPYPSGKKMFPQYLRESGYYCTNNSKEDYNLIKPGRVWDVSSTRAHWKNRRSGQPFFAVFNSLKSHEGRLRVRPHAPLHDPAKVRVPAYHPDTPEVRRDWAQYYDTITEADADAGRLLRELADAGLDKDTIVFYFADHGSGMPRSKRSACNSGLQVPLVVYIPEKWRHLAPQDYAPGGKSERLVSFVDLAPTMLSLAGIRPPDWMQGHAFLGPYATEPPPYMYGFRGRMDERYDLVRCVTDGRYVYVRNYMPHLIGGQYIAYMFQTPTTRVWKKLHDEHKLTEVQDAFWQRKAPEELYDLQNDPDEVHNLAASPEHQETRKKLQRAEQDLARRIRDVGFLPEGEFFSRAPGKSPYDLGHDDNLYPFERVFAMAERASMLAPEALPKLEAGLRDQDSAVRYWAALGILMRGRVAVAASKEELGQAMSDSSPYVRIVAANALGLYGTPEEEKLALRRLVGLCNGEKQNLFVAMAALNAVGSFGQRARPAAAVLEALPTQGKFPDPNSFPGKAAMVRYSPYLPSLLKHLKETLGDEQHSPLQKEPTPSARGR